MFIDTPPTLGMITVNALVASTHVLVPIQSSYFALEGTDDLLETIEKIKSRPNPNLQLLGVVITIHDKRTTLAATSRLRSTGLRGTALQHHHHQVHPPRGVPRVQGVDLHLRAAVERRDGVLLAERGDPLPCLRA